MKQFIVKQYSSARKANVAQQTTIIKLFSEYLVKRGGTRGGLGGYSPHRSMLAPRRKLKSDLVVDF